MTLLSDDLSRRDFHLCGAHWVRASAGTGKTYSIQSLYLRLILEMGLTVQQILVVTFTEAATKELRNRLRLVLQVAARFLEDKPPVDERQNEEYETRIRPLVAIATVANPREAIRNALLDFDLAAIHTIHGFCSRTLNRFAFETGQAFDVELTEDKHTEIDGLSEDWWRRNLYGVSDEFAALAFEGGVRWSALKELARKRIAKPDALLMPAAVGGDAFREALRLALEPGVLSGEAIPVAPAGSGLPGAASRAWSEIGNGIDLCREAVGRGDPCVAAAALLRAATVEWKAPRPWTLPDDALALVSACQSLVEAIGATPAKGFSFVDGELRHKSLSPEALAPAGRALCLAAPAAQRCLDLLQDARVHPRRTTKDAVAAFEALQTFAAHARGEAEAPLVIKAARDLRNAEKLPDRAAISLASFAPGWSPAVAGVRSVLNGLLPSAAEEVAATYHASRLSRPSMSFDDFLLNLRAALGDPERGAALRGALHAEYKAALIDEFQDTDPVQYGIFAAAFLEMTEMPCFVVGDPKQAIYGFRSGDIQTCIRATEVIPDEACHELDCNYRSEANLVRAVNQLFADQPRGAFEHTFRHPALAYDGTLRAKGKAADKSLTVDGAIDPVPLKLWLYAEPGRRPPGKDSPFARAVYADTAAEIRRLIDDPRTRIAGAPVRPDQIAVLVMTHDEAAAIADELAARGVPAVRQTEKPVFDSAEAQDLALLLAAMAEPRNAWRVRAALASTLLGVSHADIAALNVGERRPPPAGVAWAVAQHADGAALEDWTAVLEELQQTWRRHGFMAAFDAFARQSGLRSRLASLPRGARALTNVLQIAQLTHRASSAGHLSVEATAAWYARQLDADTRESGAEYEMRLETDDNAVRILTVFRSKGLEFPVVFVPTLWRRKPDLSRSALLEYHDAAGRLVIDTRKDELTKALRERLEEDIRLAYVAATRAVHRTVLVWGDFAAEEESSALAWLLGPDPGAALRSRHGDGLAVCVESRRWNDESPDAGVFTPSSSTPEALSARTPSAVEKRYGHGSFSGLLPHAGAAGPTEHGEGIDVDASDVAADAAAEVEPPSPIFAFPAGAKTGECWHRIFERLPFDATERQIRLATREQLDLFGLLDGRNDAQRLDATVGMVRAVLDARIEPKVAGALPFALRDVPFRDRKNELAFSFPASRWVGGAPRRTAGVGAVLADAWRSDPERAPFLDRLAHWDQPLPGGFMTGFIDLLFRVGHGAAERYYILDWKSNRRGGRATDFDADGLREEMALHAYFLQYLIYTVAVHQYLKRAQTGYDYERHFGGVLYVFLRGVDGTPGRGIFQDRPPLQLVEALSRELGDFA